MALVADTSVFATVDRQQGTIDDVLAMTDETELAIASITASELLAGVALSPDGARRTRREVFVTSVLGTVSILPLDLNVARVHAQLWADLQRRGMMIGRHDLIIAATAVTHGLVVLTHNVREFDRVPGLSVQRAEF
jgi:tRNA(fMet)-specific endonuclease VapC